jgi:type I restriction enzyme R subunit
MQTFDPNLPFSIVERRLPHWSQAGTITFITWRLWDSLPEKVIKQWQAERDALLRQHGIDPAADDWQAQLDRLGAGVARECQLILSDRWNEHLDECHGSCVLRRPELAGIVETSLRHFDHDRYELTDFVVMPNHVHVLAAFPDEESMLAQCKSWKHFTARKINRLLGRDGRLWQQDGFDHLVRSADHFQHYHGYIAGNPRRANLKDGEYIHYSAVAPPQ